jgi:hypothetical protein
MTQEEKRIKLAEAGGLQVIDVPFIPSQTKAAGCVFTDAARTEWRKCYPNSCGVYGVPDYFNDLNAVHDFVSQKLTTTLMLAEYEYRLRACLADGRPTFEVAGYELANAIAAQRCEALGLTLKLWKQ